MTPMGKNFKTSIYITSQSIEAYQRLVRRFGAKAAVSAALIALDKMDPSQQLQYIDIASAEETPAEKPAQQLKEILRKITEKGAASIDEPLKIHISPSDDQAWDELRKIVEAVHGKKKARQSG